MRRRRRRGHGAGRSRAFGDDDDDDDDDGVDEDAGGWVVPSRSLWQFPSSRIMKRTRTKKEKQASDNNMAEACVSV